MNKVVRFCGSVYTESGYGVHSRQVARYLLSRKDISLHLDAVRWGSCGWNMNKLAHNGLIGQMLERCFPPQQNPVDVNIELRLPNECEPKGLKNVLISAFVECDFFNPEWINNINKMDLVIVPSYFIKETILNTQKKFNKLIIPPIEVIPESFPDEILNPNLEPLNIDFSTNFNFLLVGQITGNNPYTDRKNLFFTIKYLCETFKDNKNVGIVIKTNAGRNTILDRNNCENIFKKVLQEVRKTEYPKVYLMHGLMTDEEMARLYRHPKIKAVVSLTRGEGWGLPLLESAASALPVIATNASGHLDFLNHGKWIKINYEKKPIDPSLLNNKNIFVQGMQWFEAQEEDFKKKILKFRTSSAIPKEWATELAEIIKKEYSFQSIAQKYEEVFKKYNIL